MSFRSLLVNDVTVFTRSPTGPSDNYGQPTWVTTATTVYQHGGWLEQIENLELIVGRDTTIDLWDLIMGPEAVIAAFDQVRVAGYPQLFEVVGDPRVGQSPRGVHHFTARLRSIEG